MGMFFSSRDWETWKDRGTMNEARYIEILKNLLQSAKDLRLRQRFMFQQDNDPKHAAKATLEWFQNKNVKSLSGSAKPQA